MIKRSQLGPLKVMTIMGAQAFLLFFSNLFLAKELGLENFGIFSLAFATMAILSEFSLLGGRGTIIRFVANYATNKQYGNIKGLLIYSTTVGSLVSIFILGCGFLFLHHFGHRFSQEVNQTFKCMFFLLPLNTLIMVRQFITRGLHLLFRSLAPEAILRPLLFIILLYYFSQDNTLTASMAFILYGGATFISVIVGYVITYQYIHPLINNCKPMFEWNSWIRSGVPIILASLGNSLARRLDMFIIASLLPMTHVGLYSIAMKITMSLNLIHMSIRVWAAPHIASRFAELKTRELQCFIRKAVRLSSSLAIVPAFILFVFSQEILSFFGANYIQASDTLRVLLLAEFVHISFGFGGNIMLMTALEKQYLKITIICSVISSCFLYFLIQHYGILGAAFGFLFSTLIINCCYAYTVYNKHRLLSLIH